MDGIQPPPPGPMGDHDIDEGEPGVKRIKQIIGNKSGCAGKRIHKVM